MSADLPKWDSRTFLAACLAAADVGGANVRPWHRPIARNRLEPVSWPPVRQSALASHSGRRRRFARANAAKSGARLPARSAAAVILAAWRERLSPTRAERKYVVKVVMNIRTPAPGRAGSRAVPRWLRGPSRTKLRGFETIPLSLSGALSNPGPVPGRSGRVRAGQARRGGVRSGPGGVSGGSLRIFWYRPPSYLQPRKREDARAGMFGELKNNNSPPALAPYG